MSKDRLAAAIHAAALITVTMILPGVAQAEEFARVLAVKPVVERVETPVEECRDEQVTRQKPVKDNSQITGTVLGAVAGGLLGDKLGGRGDNTGARIAGAVAGGYAGNKTQEHIQKNATETVTERACRTSTQVSERTAGYDVTYSLRGQTGQVRMDYDPGAAIPVENGRLVLTRGQ